MQKIITIIATFFFAVSIMAMPENGAFGKVSFTQNQGTKKYAITIPLDQWQFDRRCTGQCFSGDETEFIVTVVHFMDKSGKILPRKDQVEQTFMATTWNDRDYIRVEGISREQLPPAGQKILVYYQSTTGIWGWIPDVNAPGMPKSVAQSDAAKHNAVHTYHQGEKHGFLLPVVF